MHQDTPDNCSAPAMLRSAGRFASTDRVDQQTAGVKQQDNFAYVVNASSISSVRWVQSAVVGGVTTVTQLLHDGVGLSLPALAEQQHTLSFITQSYLGSGLN
jgi:hypothetical protein